MVQQNNADGEDTILLAEVVRAGRGGTCIWRKQSEEEEGAQGNGQCVLRLPQHKEKGWEEARHQERRGAVGFANELGA